MTGVMRSSATHRQTVETERPTRPATCLVVKRFIVGNHYRIRIRCQGERLRFFLTSDDTFTVSSVAELVKAHLWQAMRSGFDAASRTVLFWAHLPEVRFGLLRRHRYRRPASAGFLRANIGQMREAMEGRAYDDAA